MFRFQAHLGLWFCVLIVLASRIGDATAGSMLRVTDFGALPGDGLDDVAGIERAAAATPPDGALLFPAGEYRLGRTLDLPPDRRYSGETGAVLLWTGGGEGEAALRIADAMGGRIEGLSFVGRGVAIDGASRDLVIDGCLFMDIRANDALSIPNTSVGIAITRNRFVRIGIGELDETAMPSDISAIAVADGDGLTIADNRFDTVNQAISLVWNRVAGRDVVLARNRGERIHHAAIQARGVMAVKGLMIRDNRFRGFLWPGSATAGVSIRLDSGSGTRILGNSVAADSPAPPGDRYGAGIAVTGRDAIVESNRIEGEWAVGIALDKAPGAMVVGNLLCRSGGATILVDGPGPIHVGGNSITRECP